MGRRRLLLLGAGATAHVACGGRNDPLGGPYGGTVTSLPNPVLGSPVADDGGDDAGSGGGSPAPVTGTCSVPGDGGADDAGAQDDGGAADAGCGACPSGGNVLALTFAMYPQLEQPCGFVSTFANGYSDPTCQQSGVLVFNNGGSYVALSSSCTHACCAVVFTGSEIKCPCHGATYDLSGNPTNSVAKIALPSLPVCSDGCGVYVTV